MIDLERMPPELGQVSIVSDVVKVLAALLMRPQAHRNFDDFDSLQALISLIRSKERIGGNELDQAEFVANGMRIVKILTEPNGAILRSIRGNQLQVLHLLDIIQTNRPNAAV